MEFKDDEIKRLQLAAEAEEKKRFLHNIGDLNKVIGSTSEEVPTETPQPVREAPKSSSPLKQIRTYQGDVASALEKQQESLVSIQKREATKHEEENRENREETKNTAKSALFLGFSIVLVLLGAFGGYLAYKEFIEKTAPPIVVTPENRFIPIKEERNIDISNLNRQSFIELISRERENAASSGNNGNVTQIQLRKGMGDVAPILTSELLVLLDANPPGSLVRALDKLFMFGMVAKETPEPFLLINLTSFEQAYPGMLEWENNLRQDLLPLFVGENEIQKVGGDAQFEDLTLNNKDTRALRDNEGKLVLIYTFIDNEKLLITSDENSLKTLLNLISTSKLSR